MRCHPFAKHSWGPPQRRWDGEERGVKTVRACARCGELRVKHANDGTGGSRPVVDRGRYIPSSPLAAISSAYFESHSVDRWGRVARREAS